MTSAEHAEYGVGYDWALNLSDRKFNDLMVLAELELPFDWKAFGFKQKPSLHWIKGMWGGAEERGMEESGD